MSTLKLRSTGSVKAPRNLPTTLEVAYARF